MKRKFKHATLSEISYDTAEIKRLLLAREIDAFGANRQRLANIVKEGPGFRILPDNLFGVPQTIIVPKGKTEVLAAVNRFIDDVRASGFLKKSVDASGVAGLEVAPGGSWTPSVRIKRASRPRPRGRGLLLVAFDLGLLLVRQPDIIEAVEQAMLAVRVDLEMDDTAVRTADFLLLQIDRECRIGAASASSNSLSRSSGDTRTGNTPFLKQLL